MNVLGISCHYHDSAACLVQDGRVVAAAEEARFTRVHHDTRFPAAAIDYCLREGGVHLLGEDDLVVFYEKPLTKLRRVLDGHLERWPLGFPFFARSVATTLGKILSLRAAIEEHVGFERDVLYCEHHVSHAASAFSISPFERAALLTVDGTGERATTTLGIGEGSTIRLLEETRFPHSLGLLYSAVTAYLGFPINRGEGKVMGLAAHGRPVYADDLREILSLREDGSFALDMRYFDYTRAHRMCSRRFHERFGPPRAPGAEIEPRHRDMAASLQAVLEDALVRAARHLHARTGLTDLCMAGGVALNGPANARILRETPFERIFVQPGAGDSGGAVGCAVWAWTAVLGNERSWVMRDAYLGPAFDEEDERAALRSAGLEARRLDDEALIRRVVERLCAGAVVCWFQGRMEFGPRALGNRSILADPRDPAAKDRVNERIKHREPFRPFAASVAAEHVAEWIDLPDDSPFMLLVGRVLDERRERIPAVTHVDGTTRVQTVTADVNARYHALLEAFGAATGVPLLLNTSFNGPDEPIVCTPEDAARTFAGSRADVLVLGNHLVERSPGESP